MQLGTPDRLLDDCALGTPGRLLDDRDARHTGSVDAMHNRTVREQLSARTPTSFLADTRHTPKVAIAIPAMQTAVFVLQLEGRDHQPPVIGSSAHASMTGACYLRVTRLPWGMGSEPGCVSTFEDAVAARTPPPWWVSVLRAREEGRTIVCACCAAEVGQRVEPSVDGLITHADTSLHVQGVSTKVAPFTLNRVLLRADAPIASAAPYPQWIARSVAPEQWADRTMHAVDPRHAHVMARNTGAPIGRRRATRSHPVDSLI